MSGDADIGACSDTLTDTDTYPYRILAMIMITLAVDHNPDHDGALMGIMIMLGSRSLS